MNLTETQVKSYEKNGFLMREDLFSQPEVDLLLSEIPCEFAQESPRRILEKSGVVRSVFASHLTNPLFRTLSKLDRLVRPAVQLLGGDVYIHQFKINAKLALAGDVWEWHQDFLFWNKEDGMPTSRVFTAAIFLNAVDEFNGPLLLIPGTHVDTVDLKAEDRLLGKPDGSGKSDSAAACSTSWASTLTADLKYKIDKQTLAQQLRDRSIYSAKGRAGSALLFHGNVFHASATNLSPYDRIVVFITYNSVENRLHDVENPRPIYIASRDFRPVTPLPDSTLIKIGS